MRWTQAAPHHHATVVQRTPCPRRTPTNLFSEALAFEARCCQSALVSRVPGNRRRHLWNASPVSAGPEGPLPEGGPAVGRRAFAEDRVQCRLVVRCCHDDATELSRALLVAACPKGCRLGRRSCLSLSLYAKSLIWTSRIVASTSRLRDWRCCSSRRPKASVGSTFYSRHLVAAKHRIRNPWLGPRAT